MWSEEELKRNENPCKQVQHTKVSASSHLSASNFCYSKAKSFWTVLILVLTVGTLHAVQPLRKPFVQIQIDEKPVKTGDLVTITPGQTLKIAVELEGGRRDYCKFPDTYADIIGTAQILSRGDNGLIYLLNGNKAEWKLLEETHSFTGDDNVQVSSQPNQSTATVTISNGNFSQSFIKVKVKSIWQFSQNGSATVEDNVAEGTVYLKVAGASDVWFMSRNLQASGIKNDQVQEKLNVVQAACDSIENNFYRLKFPAVQQSIRNLQAAVNSAKSTLDEISAANPSYRAKVIFIGLPSDQPFLDLEVLNTVKNQWSSLETLLANLKQQLAKLPAEPTSGSKSEMLKIISQYDNWLKQLPQNTSRLLPVCVPGLKMDSIQIPATVGLTNGGKDITEYSKALNELNAFVNQRIERIPNEIQMISSTQNKLQAIRLFDNMLRSYFSSINWAEWKNTRE